MTVVPTASSETNLSATPATNAAGDASTIPVAAVAAAPGSGGPVSANANDGVHGLPVLRRNSPGTKAAAFCAWQEEDWTEMDSTLAVQQVGSY